MTMRAEQVTDPVAYHAEGPCWSISWGGLRWVDMLAGDVLSLAADGTIERRHVGSIAAAVRPRVGGGAVIGVERGFALEEPDGTITTLDPLWSGGDLRMNEGACDPEGRFYCGSMSYERAPGAGALHRLDPDGSTHVVLDSVTISNGLDWSPDGTRAYYNDTETLRVDVFDYVDGELIDRRPFVTITPGEGRPDGLTVDAEGAVWVALNKAGAVRRYLPDGTLDGTVEVPVSQTTACTFGGADLDRLYITTSRENLEPHEEPAAGSVFAVDVGAGGQAARSFAG